MKHYKDKQCQRCDMVFTPRSPTSTYCDDCRLPAREEYQNSPTYKEALRARQPSVSQIIYTQDGQGKKIQSDLVRLETKSGVLRMNSR